MREEKEIIKISVRDLVEFIMRSGNIDNRASFGGDKDAMLAGGKLHRKIQKAMGPGYRAEVVLKTIVSCSNFFLHVEGRADGIIEGQEIPIVDEIKTVVRDLSTVEQPIKVHLAQAKCYAYIYVLQNKCKKIKIQMTYCQIETEEIKRFLYEFRREELEDFFNGLIVQYEKWAEFQIEWKEKRNNSIKKLQFPFPYRNGQREMTVSVYRTVLRKKKLFIQASTGVGKTMATIFPTVKAVGEGLGEKIFYLTARTITRTVAEHAFDTLRNQKLRLKTITLTAKEKICFCQETTCDPEHCPYAKGHFDRVNDAIYDFITTQDNFSREAIIEQAEKYKVCPFEMELDVAVWADSVICDYNYVFDPNAHLKRFFADGTKGEYIYLIDEAHNLVERGREMYSAMLYKEDILEMKKITAKYNPKLSKTLDECNRQLLILKRECEHYNLLESVSHIAIKLMHIMTLLEESMENFPEEKKEQIRDFYFQIRDFLNIYEQLDENYEIYSELEQDGRFKVKLFCVNPAEQLNAYLEYGISTIFFSATLLPITYYKKLLSVESDDYAIYIESSFPDSNRQILLGVDVSSRFSNRNQRMYDKFAGYILQMIEGKKGNYMVFCPSYRLMEEIYWAVKKKLPTDIECILQQQTMKEEDREQFLKCFKERRQETLLAFCVLGGVFSEGIDLTQDQLIGTAIIGMGIPQVCTERDILRMHFDSQGQNGFAYAYLYPGMNKVLQAAGRVIRTEKDKGIILLLDERFQDSKSQAIFPREWKEYKTCRVQTCKEYIDTFWKQQVEKEANLEIT